VEANVLLCDFAEEVGGKLYIMGGGWSRLTKARQSATMCLAVKLSIPWEEVEAVEKIEAYLVTSAGEPVEMQNEPVRVSGELRPSKEPSATPELPVDLTFALRFEGLVLDPGVYTWRLEVNAQLLAAVPFLVLEPQQPSHT
jgi:hypothetical protein